MITAFFIAYSLAITAAWLNTHRSIEFYKEYSHNLEEELIECKTSKRSQQ